MGRIIGGIGSPHSMTISKMLDQGKWQGTSWEKLLEGFSPMQGWLAERKPDAAILIYNDHVTSFFFDRYPTFAMSVSDEHPLAEEGFGVRDLPPVRGDSDFAWHVAHSLVDDEFDLTICQELPLDHGALTPITSLWPGDAYNSCAVLPLAVNVLQFPVPSPRRLYKLGQALRRAVESYADDFDVVIVGTGGLSHQLHGERMGFRNEAWDNEFLDLLEQKPEQLSDLRVQDFLARSGAEGAESMMWLVMRGALSSRVRCIHRNYHTPLHTGFGQVLYLDERATAV